MAKRKKSRTKKRRRRQAPRKSPISNGANFIFRLLPPILILALIGFGVKLGFGMFFESDYFDLKTVNIKGDGQYEGLSKITSKLNSRKGTNIFSIDLKNTESYIEGNYPELKDVMVSRVLPDTIEVSYKIRRPFCQVDSGNFYLVSEDMVVLPGHKPSPDPGLTIINGVDISEKKLLPDRHSHSGSLKKAISLLEEIKKSGFSDRYNIVKINMYDANNPAIFIEDGTRIEIGENSFNKKRHLLEEILADLAAKGRSAKVVDLRFEDAVIIPR